MSRRGSPTDCNYTIGYGKPPASQRFAKGTSGNPRGRPRKQREAARDGSDVGGGLVKADRLWLDEATQPVNIRQEGNIRQVPAHEAVMLSLRQKALGGSIMAARAYLDQIAAAQRAQAELKLEQFKTYLTYQRDAQQEIERRRADGLPTDDILPHPADFIIDVREGTAHICGPLDESERADLDWMVQVRDIRQQEVTDAAARYSHANARKKPEMLRRWHDEQRYYDQVNDRLSPSLQKELENRSDAPGASKAGEFFQFTPENFRRLEAEHNARKLGKGRRGRRS